MGRFLEAFGLKNALQNQFFEVYFFQRVLRWIFGDFWRPESTFFVILEVWGPILMILWIFVFPTAAGPELLATWENDNWQAQSEVLHWFCNVFVDFGGRALGGEASKECFAVINS